ncbi:hypothetical protein GCM10022240_20320 [Microbacterium kribbense]|uniref:AbiEi antitoxin C-terminal domain-containing protein n=1 Tax=Microbacterium kribbense TaxID=433645 RepID=A0ABP7GLK9_9MICO
MPTRTADDLVIIRRSDRPLELINERGLRRAVQTGEWTRVASGAYAKTHQWRQLKPIARHAVRVDEVLRRLRHPVLLSHQAAAAVHGIDVLGAWPRRVDITIAYATGGRSGGAIRRHATGLDDVERIAYGEHEITTPAQTVLDLARSLPFTPAVSAVDQAIWRNRPGGALTALDEIRTLLGTGGGRRGEPGVRRGSQRRRHRDR